jgi:sigma-B regulation protein RsbU (phosphoserine phosphatase)
MALGIVDVFSYQSRNISLQRGDTLFLYTDGVTEATDRNEALFSEGRLEHELNSLHEKPVKEVITAVMQKVEAFSEGVPQADDITMMVLRYNGT